MASVKAKYEFAGVGCLIQGIGLVLLFIFPIGTIVGLILLILGSVKSKKLICSECKNPVAGKDIKLCPTCKTTFP